MLKGKIIIKGFIEVKTGLRIGGTTTGLKIGGLDQPVIKDPLGRPYIPGSSLKGKLRSLIEKKENVKLNEKGTHECTEEESYKKCPVCRIWG
ncbi:MAG: type III-A CRISPR-associated RAMP protein Csm3, partial [Candidatus Ratteibacteria bacterium]